MLLPVRIRRAAVSWLVVTLLRSTSTLGGALVSDRLDGLVGAREIDRADLRG